MPTALTRPTPRELSGRKITALILLAAIALRVPLMFESLWFDEHFLTRDNVGSLALLLKTLYSDIHPPAYFVFTWCWTSLLGDSELVLRLPSLLFGLGTIALVAALGNRFVDRRTGLWSAALVTVAPVHLWYSTEARPYSSQLFLLLLTVYAFSRLHEPNAPRRWRFLFGIALFVMAFTHYYLTAYAFAFGVLAFVTKMPHRRSVILACCITLIAMAGYVGLKLLTSEFLTEKGYLRAFTFVEAWHLLFDWFLCGDCLKTPTQPGVLGATGGLIARSTMQAVGVIAFVAGIRRLMRRCPAGDPRGWQLLLHLTWLPLFALTLTWIGKDKTYIERSMLPAYPFFAIILAAGLARLGPRHIVTWIFAGCAALTLATFYLQRDIPTVYRPNPQWREAAAWLGEQIDEYGPGLEAYTPYASPDPLSYYDERIQQARTFDANDASMRRLLGAIEGHLGTTSWPGTWADRFARDMADQFESVKRRKRDAMRMTLYWLHRRNPRETARLDRPFYLIDQGNYDVPAVQALLEDPGLEVVEEKIWPWMRVRAMRRRS